MKIISNCDLLSVHNFYSIMQTKDLRYLVKNYEKDYVFEGKELDVDFAQAAELEDAFKKISHEMNCLNVNSKMMKKKKAEMQIEYDELCYEILTKTLDIYKETDEVGVLSLLSFLDIYVDTTIEIEPQVKKIIIKTKGLKNKIKIAKIRFSKTSKGTTEDVDILNKIRKQAVYLSLNLGMNNTIDIKKTSLTQWSILNKINEDKKSLTNG